MMSESSKHHSKLLSLIFILNCLSKTSVIGISILPVISKIREKLIYEQLYEYLTFNKTVSEQQFGLTRLYSTASVLLDSSNSWYINMDQKMFNLVVLLYFKKAFEVRSASLG